MRTPTPRRTPTVKGVPVPPGVRAALRLLLDAHDLGSGSGRPPWHAAVEIGLLLDAGLTPVWFRGLVAGGYLRHGVRVRSPRAGSVTFRFSGDVLYTRRTWVLLTEEGARLARRACGRPSANGRARPPPVPHWDAECRDLTLGGRLVKALRRPALNLEAVLNALEELHWPRRIDDPIPPRPGIERREGLHDTVKQLNRFQRQARIRFRRDSTGRGLV